MTLPPPQSVAPSGPGAETYDPSAEVSSPEAPNNAASPLPESPLPESPLPESPLPLSEIPAQSVDPVMDLLVSLSERLKEIMGLLIDTGPLLGKPSTRITLASVERLFPLTLYQECATWVARHTAHSENNSLWGMIHLINPMLTNNKIMRFQHRLIDASEWDAVRLHFQSVRTSGVLIEALTKRPSSLGATTATTTTMVNTTTTTTTTSSIDIQSAAANAVRILAPASTPPADPTSAVEQPAVPSAPAPAADPLAMAEVLSALPDEEADPSSPAPTPSSSAPSPAPRDEEE